MAAAGLMLPTNRGWSRKPIMNLLIEYGVFASLALLLVLMVLPAENDAGDFSTHEPGKAHVRQTESVFISAVHRMEGQCGRFHTLQSRPNQRLLDGTNKVVLVTGAAGFIGSHTARCVHRPSIAHYKFVFLSFLLCRSYTNLDSS